MRRAFRALTECVFPAGPVPLSVYQRLQKLENRILELEGLSPEYFQSAVSSLHTVAQTHHSIAGH